MVDMQLDNSKLVDRGVKMIMNELNIPQENAQLLLNNHKNVRSVIEQYLNGSK